MHDEENVALDLLDGLPNWIDDPNEDPSVQRAIDEIRLAQRYLRQSHRQPTYWPQLIPAVPERASGQN